MIIPLINPPLIINHPLYITNIHLSSGWWLTYPSEKYEFVSWDDDIPNIWKNNFMLKPPTK